MTMCFSLLTATTFVFNNTFWIGPMVSHIFFIGLVVFKLLPVTSPITSPLQILRAGSIPANN